MDEHERAPRSVMDAGMYKILHLVFLAYFLLYQFRHGF